nr:uncharacterized protein LOC109154273 [Ipomoea batatas]
MEKKSVKIWVVLGVLIALAGAQCGEADSVYGCLGGCYNQCVVLARKSVASRTIAKLGAICSFAPQPAMMVHSWRSVLADVETYVIGLREIYD